MKKPGADDISNLFKQFGGQADRYHEIAQSNEARLSRERWPLLNAIGAEPVNTPPPVPPARPAPPPVQEQAPAQAPVPPAAAPAQRHIPRPFLSAHRADVRHEPSLTPPATSAAQSVSAPPVPPSATPLRDRYVTPATASEPGEPHSARQQDALSSSTGPASSTTLSNLFSRLENAQAPTEPAASTSSLFKRLSRT